MSNSSLDLAKYMNQRVLVNFTGGRQVIGTLKGFDQLVNLVLEDTVENLRDGKDSGKLSGASRNLGTVMCRGTTVTLITPEDGYGAIANPFVQEDE
jgi:U6 snRNA-associated Sm-like protein LSm7